MKDRGWRKYDRKIQCGHSKSEGKRKKISKTKIQKHWRREERDSAVIIKVKNTKPKHWRIYEKNIIKAKNVKAHAKILENDNPRKEYKSTGEDMRKWLSKQRI